MRTLLTFGFVFISPVALALPNTARVTLNPAFSGGTGPVDIIHQNSGAVDAQASTTGGFSSSGDASAHTQYGFIRLSAHASHALSAIASGIIQDSIKITATGIPTGTPGSLTYHISVNGTLSATSGTSGAGWQVSADVGGGIFDIGKSGTFYSPELSSHGYQGDPFGSYSATVSFQFGMDMPLYIECKASANAANSALSFGAASVDPWVTLAWGGITNVKQGATPVNSFSVSSTSGTNWGPAAALCPGDLNNDGLVDDADFVFFAQAYNLLDCADPAMPAGCPSDLNSDGLVDDADFVIFAAAYNDLICP